MIYGVFLPKDVLAKIYYKNAERILYFGDDKHGEAVGRQRQSDEGSRRPPSSRSSVTAIGRHQ